MSTKQLKFNFGTPKDSLLGFRAGFKDKELKPNASEEYKRGYINGRRRRNCDV